MVVCRAMIIGRGFLLGVVAAACLSLPAAAQTEPIRIGFLSVRTGPLAAGGRQMEEGINLLLKQRNNMLAGRKAILIVADTGGQPAQAKTRTQELIEREKVNVIIGPLATFEALALDDYIRTTGVPLITPTSAAQNDLAQQKKNEYVIHAVGTAAQPTHVLGEFAAKKLGLKRVATIADDFTYGHEGAAGFHHTFEDAGGKIVQKLWPPLNVPDYGSYLGDLKPDVVPGFYTVGTYTAGLFLEQALKTIQGKFEDKKAFVKALHAVKLTEGPIGPISLDEYGKPILNIYVRKVERKNGKLVNSIVET